MSRKTKKDKIITLVGIKQARKGFEFLHESPSEKCKKCEYYRVCIENLEVGRVYRVVGLREKVFPCPLHEGGARVVEVVESEISAAIPQKLALEGAIITFHKITCENFACKYRSLCFPIGIYEGDRCEIVSIGERIDCEMKNSLRAVKLRRIPS